MCIYKTSARNYYICGDRRKLKRRNQNTFYPSYEINVKIMAPPPPPHTHTYRLLLLLLLMYLFMLRLYLLYHIITLHSIIILLLLLLLLLLGAGRSSEIKRSLMVRWVVGSILHGVDPLSYFSFQPVLHDWFNKGRGMCYPVCGMVHIKEPLLLIDKSSLCGGSGFPFSLSEWSLTICLMPYNRR